MGLALLRTNADIKKNITRSLINVIILALINEYESHGYEIITRIKNDFNIASCPGTVYNTLNKLHNSGFITANKNGKKIIFNVTDKGRKHLKKLYNDASTINKEIFLKLENKVF